MDRRSARTDLGRGTRSRPALVVLGAALDLEEPFEQEAAADDEMPLLGRRIVLIERVSSETAVLVEALRARGAEVAVLDAEGEGAVRELTVDPDVIVVDHEGIAGWAAGALRVLRHDPRMRWAPVLAVRAPELWPGGGVEPDVARLESKIRALLGADDSLTRRAHAATTTFETQFETTGPARLLRALSRAQRAFHLTVRGRRASVELDLAEGLVLGAKARIAGAGTVTGMDALAILLAIGSGRVRVEPMSSPVANLMIPIDDALAATDEVRSAIRPSISPPTVLPPMLAPGRSWGELESLFAHLSESGMTSDAEDRLDAAADVSDDVYEVLDSMVPPRAEETASVRMLAPVGVDPPAVTFVAPPPAAPVVPRAAAPRRGRASSVVAAAVMALATVAGVTWASDHARPTVALVAHASSAPQRAPLAVEQEHNVAPEAPVAAAAIVEAAIVEPLVVETAVAEPSPETVGELTPGAIELEGLELAPRTVTEVLVDRANVSRARGNFLEAEADYLGALRREPANERAAAGIVRLYLARPDARLALQWARRLIEIDRRDPDHHVLLGDVLQLGGDPTRARNAWRRAIALDPDHRVARQRLGR